MWIVASTPFWIIGMAFLIVAFVGTWVTVNECRDMEEAKFKGSMISLLFCYSCSGLALLLAAKIAS